MGSTSFTPLACCLVVAVAFAAADLAAGLPAAHLAAPSAAAGGCGSDADCSLNGLCTASACICDKPWQGPACTILGFKVTPASAKSLYNITDPRNTWNGPIVTAPNGKFHLFDPIYKVGSLGGPTEVLHGVADVVTGPYDWNSRPTLPSIGENPAFVVFNQSMSGKTEIVFSLWEGGKVRVSSSVDGPYITVDNFGYPGGNPAPVYHNGAFYMTTQGTDEVVTTSSISPGSTWTKFAEIVHPAFPGGNFYHVEDPFMWVDKRGNWHIINHAYRNDQWENCGTSVASAHWHSADGRNWTWTPQPYGHTVAYDDGTSHTYTTLERPNLHFDPTGQLTHLNLAADLVTGDEGCGSRTRHAHDGHTPCDNCKWDDHAGTIIITLDA